MALTKGDALISQVDGAAVASIAGSGATSTGTFGAPTTYRSSQDGIIKTTIKFDLTGLGAKGDAADDVIGIVSAAPDAYIGRIVTSTCGIVFKAELSCIEVAAGSATITVDTDLACDSASDNGYDQPVGGTTLINGGTLVAGQTKENLVATTTANDYIYIVEGDTAATTGVYTSGQYILTLYGHAVLA